MSSTRRRSARPDPARRRLRSNLETLESRQLLAQSPYLPIGNYSLQDFPTDKPPWPTPDVSITKPGSATLSTNEVALTQTTGVVIHGSIGTLEFGGIDGRFPKSFNPLPITIAIGDPTTPTTGPSTIRIDHIYNTSYDDTAFAAG